MNSSQIEQAAFPIKPSCKLDVHSSMEKEMRSDSLRMAYILTHDMRKDEKAFMLI